MKKFNAKTFYNLIFAFIILAVIAKIYQYTMMKAYSFGIMNRILGWLYMDNIPGDSSYAFPVKVYRYIRFLGFKTNLEWSIFFAIIMNIVIFSLLIKFKDKYSKQETIFIYASMFILDVFVFNLNKDLVQGIMILIMYGVIKNQKLSNIAKLVIVSSILVYESINFRPYYILIVGLLLLNYFVFYRFTKTEKAITKKKVFVTIVAMLLLMFIGISLTKYIQPDSYEQLIHRRDNIERDIDANTIIVDWVKGDSYIVYCINYVINFVRICFPIELILKGKFYIIFVIYQIYLTINLIKGIKGINKDSICYKSFILAYWMTMVASESDFGTLVRHQSILIMFYMMLINDNLKLRNINNKDSND